MDELKKKQDRMTLNVVNKVFELMEESNLEFYFKDGKLLINDIETARKYVVLEDDSSTPELFPVQNFVLVNYESHDG